MNQLSMVYIIKLKLINRGESVYGENRLIVH